MAERKNFLDREYEKKKEKDGDGLLPYSIALIPGLTALEQDALVKDIAEGLVKRNVEALGFDPENAESIYAATERRKAADKLEEYMQRLPEPMRDSYLISSIEGAPPYFYGDTMKMKRGIQKGTSGFYDQSKNRVYLDMDRFLDNTSTAIHENAHKMNHDLNLSHPYYDKVAWEVVPDRMVGIGLGRKLSEEMPKTFITPKGEMDKGELVDELSRIVESGTDGEKKAYDFYRETLERTGLLNVVEAKKTPEMNRKQWHDRLEFVGNKGHLLDDFVNLDPAFEGREYSNTLKGSVTEGHPRSYMDAHRKYADQIEWALTKGGKAERDFVEHWNTVPYAALSAESAAELAELMATEGGEEYVKTRFPKLYEDLMDEYRSDPRKSMPKEKLLPWRLYSHDSPENVYKQRSAEPAAYDPNEERHYIRVPNPYGEWLYSDDYYRGRSNALKQEKNYVEYRDLDGKWRRFYPDELKGVAVRNTIVPEYKKILAKKLVKNIVKYIK